jgi:hypothetical protein
MILLNSEKQCIYMYRGRMRRVAAVVVGEEEEEVSLGVIMTNTDIKFHILFFTLRSSSVSQSLSFNFLQTFYCPFFSVLALCLQIKVWSFSYLRC